MIVQNKIICWYILLSQSRSHENTQESIFFESLTFIDWNNKMCQWKKLIIWLVTITKNNGNCWRKYLLKHWYLKFAQLYLQDRKRKKKRERETFGDYISSQMQHYINLYHTRPSLWSHNYMFHDISLTQFLSGNTWLKLKKTSWNKYY